MASTSKKSNGKSNKKSNNNQIDDKIVNELVIIGIFVIAVILFLCNFGIIGPVGNGISRAMFGLFGALSYIFPLLLFGLIAFGVVNKNNIIVRVRIICISIIYLFVSVLLELINGINLNSGSYDIKAIFVNGADNHKGGGIFAGSLAYFLNHYLDKAGTVLISLAVIIICLIIVTGKSLINALKNGGIRAYEDAREYKEKVLDAYEEDKSNDDELYEKEDNRPRRSKKASGLRDQNEVKNPRRNRKYGQEEEYDEAIKEKPATTKELRRNRKASGVNMDGFDVKESDFLSRNDMHEITVNDIKTVSKVRKVAVSNDPFEDLANVKIHGDSMREIEIPDVNDNIVPEPKDITHNYSENVPVKPDNYTDINEVRFNTAKADKQTDMYDSESVSSNQFTSIASSKPVKKTHKKYKAPGVELLNKMNNSSNGISKDELMSTARVLQDTLETFGVKAKVTDISQGPSVTRYELQPEVGVRVNKIVQLADDIKLALAATDVRIEAPIPGKAAVGIEVPNKVSTGVALRDLFESQEFKKFDSKISFAVGKDISGNVVVTDIAKMPHMLIAGSTGSGKSVCINTIIMSILYKASPEEVKLIMVDPKVVELSVYNGIPHLMVPVVTDPKKAAAALHWGVAEMTDRYQKFAEKNVRDLKGYNEVADEKLPQIVIIVDELADLMMVAAKEVEESICRLAQLARACGIHLIIATQRPSVDVITGLIKANMPSRVAFAVSSGVDSRTILDMNGAEKLLGKGDMLFYPQGYPKPARVQGAFVSDGEVQRVVNYLKDQYAGESYQVEMEEALKAMNASGNSGSLSGGSDSSSDYDDLIRMAGNFIIDSEKASIGALQRKFKIGFNRAARIMDQLCELGVVSEEQGTKPRTILMGPEQFEQIIEEIL